MINYVKTLQMFLLIILFFFYFSERKSMTSRGSSPFGLELCAILAVFLFIAKSAAGKFNNPFYLFIFLFQFF